MRIFSDMEPIHIAFFLFFFVLTGLLIGQYTARFIYLEEVTDDKMDSSAEIERYDYLISVFTFLTHLFTTILLTFIAPAFKDSNINFNLLLQNFIVLCILLFLLSMFYIKSYCLRSEKYKFLNYIEHEDIDKLTKTDKNIGNQFVLSLGLGVLSYILGDGNEFTGANILNYTVLIIAIIGISIALFKNFLELRPK